MPVRSSDAESVASLCVEGERRGAGGAAAGPTAAEEAPAMDADIIHVRLDEYRSGKKRVLENQEAMIYDGSKLQPLLSASLYTCNSEN